MRNATRAWEWAEVSASCEVIPCVLCWSSVEGRRQQIRVSRRRKLERRTEGVTPVAIRLRVDDITAQSDQRGIFSIKVQGHGCNPKTLLNLGFIVSLVAIIFGAHSR